MITGRRRRRLGSARCEQRHADLPVADDAERGVRLDHGRLDQRADLRDLGAGAEHDRTRRIRRSARSETTTVTSPRGRRRGRPAPCVSRSGCCARGPDAPDVELGGIVLRREEDVVADVEDRRDLEPARRDRLAVHRDPTGVLALLDEHEASVRQAIGHSGHDRLPVLRGVVDERLRLPGVGVDLEHEPALLIARQDEQRQRASVVPRDVDEVRERVAVPVDVHARPVESEDRERDVRVVGARLRVPNGAGWRVRVDRRRDVPHEHRALVDARRRDPLAVRRPPVPTMAIQLLRCRELRDPPVDVRVVVVREDPARPSDSSRAGRSCTWSAPSTT